MTHLPYDFTFGHAGPIGFVDDERVCGALAHYDDAERLIWFNGGLAVNKAESANELMVQFLSVKCHYSFN